MPMVTRERNNKEKRRKWKQKRRGKKEEGEKGKRKEKEEIARFTGGKRRKYLSTLNPVENKESDLVRMSMSSILSSRLS